MMHVSQRRLDLPKWQSSLPRESSKLTCLDEKSQDDGTHERKTAQVMVPVAAAAVSSALSRARQVGVSSVRGSREEGRGIADECIAKERLGLSETRVFSHS